MNGTRTDNNERYDNGSISMWRLLKIIKKHFILVIVMTVLVAVGSFAVAKYAITPQYTSTAQILVNQKNATANGQAFNNQQADVQMINTYKELINNHKVLSKTQKQLANPTEGQVAYQISYRKLEKMVSVRTIQNAQVFELKAQAPDAHEAATIANTVTSVFQKQVKSDMGYNNTKVTSKAYASSKPSFPNVILFTLGGVIVGFFLGSVIAVIKEVD